MDYHIHTKASLDATGTMKEYVRAAEEKNINEIGFSDHQNVYPEKTMRIPTNYSRTFFDLKEKSGSSIKLGVEIDFFPEDVDNIREFIQKHPFDYVIGSVHVVGHWSIDSNAEMHEYSKKDILEVYTEYFDLIQKLCKSQLFDILAHPDLIKIFGYKPNRDVSHILKETAETMAESNICAEINTRGLRRPCAEIYPSLQFLKILHNHNVPITFGSDSHEPSELGGYFKEAVALARKAGYTHACKFDRRKRTIVKLGEGYSSGIF